MALRPHLSTVKLYYWTPCLSEAYEIIKHLLTTLGISLRQVLWNTCHALAFWSAHVLETIQNDVTLKRIACTWIQTWMEKSVIQIMTTICAAQNSQCAILKQSDLRAGGCHLAPCVTARLLCPCARPLFIPPSFPVSSPSICFGILWDVALPPPKLCRP